MENFTNVWRLQLRYVCLLAVHARTALQNLVGYHYNIRYSQFYEGAEFGSLSTDDSMMLSLLKILDQGNYEIVSKWARLTLDHLK